MSLFAKFKVTAICFRGRRKTAHVSGNNVGSTIQRMMNLHRARTVVVEYFDHSELETA